MTKSFRKIAQNRRAHYDYFIEDTVEAGIMLAGSEVKALREGKANINDAYADAQGDEIFLLNAHISEYKGANRFNHETGRPRKLLLRGKQINKFLGGLKKKGITLVPLSLYFNEKGRVKVELAVAKGKKQYDKRATEKEKEWNRDKARILKDTNQ
jgi:SsrA-binding protein